MSQNENFVNCIYKTLFLGSIADIHLEGCSASEIRSDIVLKKYDDIQFWGYLRNSKGCIVENALVELHKAVLSCNEETYCNLAQTITDCNGFYQIDVSMAECNTCYKIVVEKYKLSSEDIKGRNAKYGRNQCIRVPLLSDRQKY